MKSLKLDSSTAAIIMQQVLTALDHAHSQNVSHRDLKTENIMFDEKTGSVKIIDFGFGVISKEKIKNFCGTPSYMSPQIIER